MRLWVFNARSRCYSIYSAETQGMILGVLAVMCFAFTLPLTRYVTHYLDPWFVGVSRTVLASPVAAFCLWWGGASRPTRSQFKLIALSAIGVTLVFPICIAFALHFTPASHAGVVVGLLPLMTAVIAAWIAKERLPRLFWVIAVIGAVLMLCYSLQSQHQGAQWSDLLLLLAVIFCALGYATGGMLAKELAAWQVICWTVLLSAPLLLIPTYWFWPHSMASVPVSGWLSLAYLVLISQLIGFFIWNKGLALGGIARVSQTQLLQPFLTLLIAAGLFGEQLTLSTLIFAVVIVFVVASAKTVASLKHR